MSEISLQIKIDSAPAQSGAQAIRNELDQLKSKYGEVIALQGMVADSVTNASAKIIAAAERKAAAETSAAAKIEAAAIAAAAKVEAASVAANAKAAIAAENRAARETAAIEKATAAASNQVSTYDRAAASIMAGDERRQQTQKALIDTADRAAAAIMAAEIRRAEATENAAARAAAAAAQEEAAKARAVAAENELVERAAAAIMAGEMRKAEAAQKAASEQQRAVASLTGIYAPHIAELQRLSADEAKLNELWRAGAMSADAHSAALSRLHQRQQVVTIESQRMAEGARLNAYEMRNLSYQINDVVSGLAMGQSPMMILTQQGGQFVQIFQAAGIKIGGVAAGLTAFAAVAATATAAAISHSNSMRDVAGAYAMQGGYVGLSTSQLEEMARQSAATGQISVRESRAIEAASMRAGQVSGAALKTISDSARHVADALTDGDITKAGELLTKAFLDPEKAAKELDGTLNFLTDTQRRQITVLAQRNDKEAAFNVIIDALNPRLKEHADTIHPLAKLWTEAKNAASDYWATLGNALGEDTTQQKLEAAQNRLARMGEGPMASRDVARRDALRKEIEDLRAQLASENAAAGLTGDQQKWQAQYKTGADIARPMSPGFNERDALEGQLAKLNAAEKAALNTAHDSETLKQIAASKEAVTHALATYVTEGKRAELIAEAHAKAATMDDMAARKFLATREAEISLMGKAVVASEREAKVKAAGAEATAAEAKAYAQAHEQMAVAAITTREKAALAGLDSEREAISQRRNLLEISAADEIALQREQDDKKRQAELDAAQQRLAVLRRTQPEEYAAIDAAERAITELRAKQTNERQKQVDAEVAARAAAARQIAQIELDAAAQQANAALAIKQEALSFGSATGAIGGADVIAQERAIADQRYQIELELLQKKLALAGIEETERARINAQIVALEQQRSLQVLQIDHKETTQRITEVKQWTDPVKQGVSSTVSSFATGANTMGQAARRGAQTIATGYISKFTDVAATWLQKRVVMSAWDKLFAAQEVATATATQTRKTAAVVTGETAQTAATRTGTTTRTALTATEGDSFLGRIGTMVASWFGFEAEKTGQTVVGSQARMTATELEAVVAAEAAKAVAAASIPAYAAEGAAAAMASVAAIPVVGWAMAPGVGAEHFAAAMAFLPTASAEGGWGEVPKDGVVTELHKKEMVLPARLADPLRDMLTGGGASAMAAGAGMKLANIGRAGDGMSFPAGLTRPANGNVQNVTNNDGNSTTFAPVVHVNVAPGGGWTTKEDIMRNSHHIAKAVTKELRNFNSDARPRR